MQVDHRQAQVIGADRAVGVQQEVADVAVAVVDPGAVHGADHLRHLGDQRTLQARLGWRLQPIQREDFQIDGRRQFLGDDEGVLCGRIAAALAIRHRGHGSHPGLMQALQGTLLLARPQHRKLGTEQVLDDLAPADAAVDLHEIAATFDLSAQRAAALQLAVDLALQAFDFGERVLAGPEGLEGLVQFELHARSRRIRSAACCGML